jgi:predicted ATPase
MARKRAIKSRRNTIQREFDHIRSYYLGKGRSSKEASAIAAGHVRKTSGRTKKKKR